MGSRRDLSGRLTELATGVTTRWVEARLGVPVFVRSFPREVTSSTELDARKELIYRTRHAWVQVLVNDDDAVVRFSITVTDPKFHFPTKDLTLGNLDLRLGDAYFHDIRSEISPQGRSLSIGARRFEYAEAYYFGNPGNYQHFVVSYNDAGVGTFHTPPLDVARTFQEGALAPGNEQASGMSDTLGDAPFILDLRARTTINTLTILGPHSDLEDLAAPRGADYDQVRLLG